MIHEIPEAVGPTNKWYGKLLLFSAVLPENLSYVIALPNVCRWLIHQMMCIFDFITPCYLATDNEGPYLKIMLLVIRSGPKSM